jgi:hypothetical protein
VVAVEVDAGEAAVAEAVAAVVAVVVSMFPHNPLDFYSNSLQHGPEVITILFVTPDGRPVHILGRTKSPSGSTRNSTALSTRARRLDPRHLFLFYCGGSPLHDASIFESTLIPQ